LPSDASVFFGFQALEILSPSVNGASRQALGVAERQPG
jgi:hypothetical protein